MQITFDRDDLARLATMDPDERARALDLLRRAIDAFSARPVPPRRRPTLLDLTALAPPFAIR